MIKHKTYLTVGILSLLFASQTHTMDGMSRRHGIPRELPEINKSGADFAGDFYGVLTYHDDNFIQKFLELIGVISTDLNERSKDTRGLITQSIQVRSGHWRVNDEDVIMSTGNIQECVAIIVQHKNPHLVAMYHYYQKADEDFVILDTFLSEIQNKANRLAINVADLSASLVSSYMSANFLIIKRAMQDKAFNVKVCHVRPRAWLARGLYVNSSDTVTCPGRLIIASSSVLKIHMYEYNDPGNYDSDLPLDNEDCIIS